MAQFLEHEHLPLINSKFHGSRYDFSFVLERSLKLNEVTPVSYEYGQFLKKIELENYSRENTLTLSHITPQIPTTTMSRIDRITCLHRDIIEYAHKCKKNIILILDSTSQLMDEYTEIYPQMEGMQRVVPLLSTQSQIISAYKYLPHLE